jgi:uncharacterized membrane protein YccC
VSPSSIDTDTSDRIHPLRWLVRRDPDLGALRRAGRAAIVMPGLFAVGDKLLENPVLATFAGFGSFAMLLLVDFRGPLRDRLQAQAALGLVGCAFICLATLVSRSLWLAAAATAIVGFGVIFAGVVSSVLAGASTSLLLAFILPVTLAGPVSSVPDRVAGWAMAAAGALVAVTVLWPAPVRDPLRAAARSACGSLAERLRAEVECVMSSNDPARVRACEQATARASEEVAALRGRFLASPYRPTGLSTAARTLVRLVDELGWLDAIVAQSGQSVEGTPADRAACAVKLATADVLERCAELLGVTGGYCRPLHEAMLELTGTLRRMEDLVTADKPRTGDFISALDPSFRAQELAFAVSLIGRDVDLTAAAERRSWLERLLGRQPQGLAGTLAAAQGRAASHFDRRSVWLHNSVRGAAGLAIAVIVAHETGVQHSFWVVLGTISVLRSNALSTGQNVLRGLLGTVAGVVIGGAILTLIGANTTLLWFLLAPAILLAGVAPAAISFAAGQAAFTLTLVFLFNIIQPAGWRVGLVRVEDIAIGCGVSLLVGLLFWPRGAGAALRRALGDAYTQSAAYLSSAVDFGMVRCDLSATSSAAPTEASARAAAAARRLDDTFRNYLAERGAKPTPLAAMTSLVSGIGGLRLAGDAIIDLWQREDGSVPGDRAAARRELLQTSERVRRWYEDLADSLLAGDDPRAPLAHDSASDDRLVKALRDDLSGDDGRASGTAVRMIWTGDHLDAARRLQQVIFGPARAAGGG